MSDLANPYFDSKRLWNDVYGTLENKLRNALAIIVVLSFVIVVSVGAVIYMASRSHIIPYVVTLRGNELVTVNELKSDAFATIQPKLALNLSELFLQQVRNRTLDKAVNQDNHIKAYAVASNSTSAVVKDHFEEMNKDDLLVKIEINAALLKSNNTLQLRWKENRYDRLTGAIQSAKSYSAELTYQFASVSLDPVVASHNPLGFYITSCAWSEDLTSVRE